MFDQYHSAILENGLTAEFEFLDDSENFFWVPPGYETPLSIDSVRAILTQNSIHFKKIKLYWEDLNVMPLAKNLASYTGIAKGEMLDTTDRITKVRLIESGTLIKRKSGWKLLSGQSANLKIL